MKVNLMSTVKLNLVKFHNGTGMQILHSTSTCWTTQLLADTNLKDIHSVYISKICANNAITRN